MPIIHLEIFIEHSKEFVFSRISSIDFMRAVDPNFGMNTIVLFQNERLLRTRSKIERIGEVEIERIYLPETFTIITQRRRPLEPFVFQLSIIALIDQEAGTTLKWTDEFELNAENADRGKTILSIIENNDSQNLLRTKEYLDGSQ